MRTATLLSLLSLLSVTTLAAPVHDVSDPSTNSTYLEKRLAPGTVEFFYDTHCKFMGGQASIAANQGDPWPPLLTGGPYGTRSAWWTSTGSFRNWGIQGGQANPPRALTQHAAIRQCVTWSDGVYVWGTVDTVVHK